MVYNFSAKAAQPELRPGRVVGPASCSLGRQWASAGLVHADLALTAQSGGLPCRLLRERSHSERLFAALVRKEELRAETGMLAGASPECGLPVAGSFSGPGEWSRLGMFEPSMVCSPGLALKVQSELFAD